MRLRSFIPPLGMMLLAAGQAGAQGVLIDKSEIRFQSKQMGANVEGRFRRWKANIVFAPKDLGGDKYEGAGKLTVKGITHDAVVPITLKKDATGNSVAEGSFTLKRLDYKIGEGEWADPSMVANDVLVRIRMVL